MTNYPLPNEIWNHYKGGVYEIVSLAKHTETEESMVVYRSVPFGTVYVRPLKMWEENVEGINGKTVARFQKYDPFSPSTGIVDVRVVN
jgi:hypothetical protein